MLSSSDTPAVSAKPSVVCALVLWISGESHFMPARLLHKCFHWSGSTGVVVSDSLQMKIIKK
jgi:hypothetical protein